jgi:1-deoxy-D-xylulose-5-phosphate synthase
LSILDRINCSNDIKSLSNDELVALCKELREFEIENIAKTGGHLASNLGAVELTVALHRVYDTSVDRLVFDVGHQSYTHKIITGRRDAFSTLRQYGGLSGFPKPYEAVDDAFIAGHASNSVSVALGMARARTLNKEDYNVVAIIGDGALTGGLAYEGLADAAASNEPLVIILNDNNMSISENVGGMSRMLQMMRVRPGYISFKKWFRAVSKRMPHVYGVSHKLKEWIKSRLLPDNIFQEMGLNYLGPIDGHNLTTLETAIHLAKDMEAPVLLHVVTTKGKGCDYAEQHPDKYHGVGSFDAKTGFITSGDVSFSDKMGEYLCQMAENDNRIVAITAAMAGGTGIECFANKFPERFFDTGITEGHSTAMAAGMAKQGLIPVFAVYSSFLQRGYDMLIHDVSLQHLHAVFCVDRAGLVGSDGETHHGVFDVSYLTTIPGMTILAPASFQELRDMLGYAIRDINGPVAVRYPRGGEGKYTESHVLQEYVLREGTDVTIICYGTMVNEALSAAEVLSARGISAEIIKLGMLTSNCYVQCMASLKKTGRLVFSEEVCAPGCVGARILTEAAMNGVNLRGVRLLNLGTGIVPHGKVSELMHDNNIDSAGIIEAAEELCSVNIEVK